MLGLVTGDLGSGKTLFETYLATKFPDEDIYSNFHIKLKNVKPLTVQTIDEIRQGLILIDEAYEWLESRTSGSEMNLYLSRLIFKSRKRGIDIFCSTQLESTLDLRFRDLNHLRVQAYGMIRNKGFLYVINRKAVKMITMQVAERLFDLYDTMEEEITIRPTVFDTKTIEPKIKELTEKILKKYGKLKYTRGTVEDIFITNSYDMTFADWVFQRLRRLRITEAEA